MHVLTGFVPTGTYTEEAKILKVKRLGVKCTKLHLCEGESMEDIGYTKARILMRLGITFMIDDDPTFVKEMVHNSSARIVMVIR